ncbi:MAG: preprotein translocase subunit YajC [Bacteroidales bacterium]|nr:preprotein translocase subunit YajC [Bacteroidales bacterium]
MNILSFFLQAAPAGQAQGGSLSFILMMVLIFAVMWLFMIRPQRKQQKELEKFRNELKKGDDVITAGGILGKVAEITETDVLIKVDGEVKLRVNKNFINKA